MKSVMAKTQDGTITLNISIPSDVVKKAWEEELEKVVEQAELPGFRKGKAPKKAVEEKLDKAKLQEDVLRKLLPKAYSDAVTEHNLKPVINPKIHVDPSTFSGQEKWMFTATTCETPEVKLNNYKEKVKQITSKSKIIVPGKDLPAGRQGDVAPNMDDIVKALLEEVNVTVPQVLADSETERLLVQLLDEIKTLGLTLDQYLSSTHRTIEDVKKEYATRATNDISI